MNIFRRRVGTPQKQKQNLSDQPALSPIIQSLSKDGTQSFPEIQRSVVIHDTIDQSTSKQEVNWSMQATVKVHDSKKKLKWSHVLYWLVIAYLYCSMGYYRYLYQSTVQTAKQTSSSSSFVGETLCKVMCPSKK